MDKQDFASIQDFYNFIDGLCDRLQKDGFTAIAQKISYLIHKVSWTTSSELLEELRNTLGQIDKNKLSVSVQGQVDMCLNIIKSYIKA